MFLLHIFLYLERGPKNVKLCHLSKRGGPIHKGPTVHAQFLIDASVTSSKEEMLDVGC